MEFVHKMQPPQTIITQKTVRFDCLQRCLRVLYEYAAQNILFIVIVTDGRAEVLKMAIKNKIQKGFNNTKCGIDIIIQHTVCIENCVHFIILKNKKVSHFKVSLLSILYSQANSFKYIIFK